MNLSLKVKIDGPEVLGSVDLAAIRKCPFHVKSCSNECACEILGQCLLTHKLIRRNKTSKRQLMGKVSLSKVLKIFESLSNKSRPKK